MDGDVAQKIVEWKSVRGPPSVFLVATIEELNIVTPEGIHSQAVWSMMESTSVMVSVTRSAACTAQDHRMASD